MKFTLPFAHLSKNDVGIAGGKGASLGEMIRAGIPVPQGFVILADAFEHFIHTTEITADIDSILHKVKHEDINSVEKASEEIKSIILSTEMPKEIEKEILQSYKQLNAKWVAVRSSATSEDSASAAWAGQLDSYLNTSEDKLLENVKKCWASLFTPRAIFYRFEKNLHNEKISVAVVVQKMVESEISGIAFSVHPVTQDYNQLIIEAGIGLGEAIVSGQITPDSYVVEKKGWLIIEKNTAEQTKALVKAKNGGNEWINLGEEGKKQKLSDGEILELSKLIVRIEDHYGFPVDVEWAREKGKFYIVQSRPITTLTQKQEIQEKSTNYIRMFGSTGMPFLINSIALEHYKPLKAMAIFRNNLWTTFLPKSTQNETLKEGVELFGSKALFEEYSKEFKDYKNNSNKYFQDITSKQKVSKVELEKFFDLIAKLWFYYRKTEFFYVDHAYRKSRKDKIILENLKHLEEIKNSGREHLNKMIFGSLSYLSKVLGILSKNFKISVDDLFFYSKEELLDLYDNKMVEKSVLEDRRRSYVFLMRDNRLINLGGEEAENYISKFLIEHKSGEEVKGTIANPGKIKGKAKVLFYGADTFDKVSKMMEEMKQGDILVTETTSPEIMPACKKASAILTNQGGLLSHAAIVSRELDIPCIVGLGDITHVVKDGDLLEVDANEGVVRILEGNKSLVYEDIFNHDFPLILAQINNQGESVKDIPWVKEPFTYKPYCIHARINGMLHYLYDSKGIEWKKVHAGKFNKEKCIEESYKSYNSVKDIIEKEKALSRIELIDFWKKLKQAWIWFDCFFWMIEDYERKGMPMDDLLKLRKDTEYIVPGSAGCFRNTLKRLFPNYTKYVDVITYEEAVSGKLPRENVLKKRLKEFAYADNTLFSNADEAMKTYNIKLKKEQTNANQKELRGQTAYPGKVVGKVRIIEKRYQIIDFQQGDIIVSSSTTPDFLPAMKKSSAIISEHGGAISHAAITSRELKIPCIVGVKDATQILHDGDLIEVDADNGIVRILKNNKEKVLVNIFSREKTLSYFGMWDDSDRKGMKIFNEEIKNNLFLVPPLGQKGSVWYEQEELVNLKQKLINKLKKSKDNSSWELTKKLAEKSWKFIEPFAKDKKKINNIKELEEYYDNLVDFWVCLNSIMYEVLDNKEIDKTIRNYLVDFRDKTEKYTERMSSILTDYLEKKTKLKEMSNFVTMKEVLDILSDKITKDNLEKIKKRSKGCFMLNQIVYPYEELEEILKKEGLSFEKIESVADELHGNSAFGGVVKGIVKIIDGFNDLEKIENGDVLVTQMTNPKYLSAIKKAVGVITDQGGTLCHAAIIARELKKPCIIATKNATKVLKDGDKVEINANKGVIKILEKSKEKKDLSKEDINLGEWEFEFQQRNEHPILMADFWCRALYRKFVREINLPVEPYDYFFTTSSKGYVKTVQKKVALEEIKKAFNKNNTYSTYLHNQTIKRVNELEATKKYILGEINKETSNKRLVELWEKFDEIFLTVIPWYWIPYYPIEQNILSDKIKEGLMKYNDKIEKITEFNNAFMISISPTKEMAFKEEQKDFFDLVKIAIKKDSFSKDQIFNEKAKEYLKKYSWMNTFILLPIEPLSLNELIHKVKKAIEEKSIETYLLQEKKKAENEEISKKILQIIGKDKKLLSAIEDIQKIGWVLTWSVETSLHTLADLQPFFKLIAKHLGVPYSHWIHLTSDEIIQILEGKKNLEEMDLKEREKGYFFVMEKGIQKMVVGEKGRSLSEWVEKNLNSVDENITELKGQSACSGHVKGRVRIALIAKDSYKLKEGEILVCAMTSPDYVPAMKRASAVITDEGGMLSHAAIMSREFGKPCIIGTKIATQVLKDGDFVEVDANTGVIKILRRSN